MASTPPLSLQIKAWKERNPELRTIGAILGEGHESLVAEARRVTAEHGIRLDFRIAGSDRETLFMFQRMAPDIDGFWLFPDNRILSVAILHEMLAYASRHQVEVAVFNAGLLEMGATLSSMSVYSDVAKTALSVASQVTHGDADRIPFLTPLSEINIQTASGVQPGIRLIIKVANQLVHTVGERGTVARFGGDEFTVLLKDVTRRETRVLAESILDDMRRLAHIEENQVIHVHCSIGIAMIGSGKSDTDELMARVDIACRHAKTSGRNRLAFHSVSEREAEQMAADVNWISRLREAIDTESLVLRYQPIVCVATGNTSHHEVLLRMKGDNGKMIGPDAFLPANAVMFEITESLAARHLNHVERQIASFRELGCEVALDDFGTGYSSFSYLQQLSVDYIKIDGAFIKDLVKNPVDQKMVQMISEIGREAGMKIVAEYVQDYKTFRMLGELGVDYAQGFYIGRPTATPIRKSMPASCVRRKVAKRGKAKMRAVG